MDVRNLLRHGARLIGAGIVDDHDFVGHARLREQGMKAGGKKTGFGMGADETLSRNAVRGVIPAPAHPPSRARRSGGPYGVAVVYPRAYPAA
jgi:hypothetical protein